VNCVAPGITLTPLDQDSVEALPADNARTRLQANIALEPYSSKRE